MTSPIQVYPGTEGIKQVYEASLKAKSVDIVCLSKSYETVIGDYFDQVYSPKLYGSTIQTREILPDTFENRDYAKTKDGTKNQVHFLKIDTTSESDYLLFDGQLALISYNPSSPFALLIGDPGLVTNLQNQFTTLWQALSK